MDKLLVLNSGLFISSCTLHLVLDFIIRAFEVFISLKFNIIIHAPHILCIYTFAPNLQYLVTEKGPFWPKKNSSWKGKG